MSESEVGAEPLVCEKVGEAMPDIAGYGVLIGLSVQAFISLALSFWVFFLTKLGRLDIQHPEGTPEHASEKKRLGFVSSILMTGNDLQMITGIALITTTLASASDIDLYHLHLVYDTVSFVGISNAAALVCWTFTGAKLSPNKRTSDRRQWNARYTVSYLFALLFLGLTIFLEVRLDGWSLTSEEMGHCYITTGTTAIGAHHPTSDKTYVAVTAIWLLLVMFGSIFASAKFRRHLLILSGLQFPVHLYMMIKLRSENQDALEGPEDENHWDFGQTTATMLLAIAISELIHQAMEYYKFEAAMKKYGPEYALSLKDEKEGTPMIMEEGIRSLRKLKSSGSSTRLDRSGEVERHEESYELMGNSENTAYIRP
ncbi:hypothetical protein M426DRAFT_317511 [Hypoxylon sp. CI-4A]|nr:hypothetical protein M426DRAFT_317511 [Hypoxylon sp. CI-4A]